MSGTSSREALSISSVAARFGLVAGLAVLDLELALPLLMLFGLLQLVYQQNTTSNQSNGNSLLQKSLMLLPLLSKTVAATQASYFEKYSWGAEVSINDMLTLPTGGHIVAGSIVANNKQQPLLAHFSNLGEVRWAFRFNNTGAFYSLLDSSEGKFLVGGKLTIPQLRDYWTNAILFEIDSAQPSVVRAVVISNPTTSYIGDISIPISDMVRDGQENLIVAEGSRDDDGPIRITKLRPDWQLLNAVEYNAPNSESVTNIAIDNNARLSITILYNQNTYFMTLDPQLSLETLMYIDEWVTYMMPATQGGYIALLKSTSTGYTTKFLISYQATGQLRWYHQLNNDANYYDNSDTILVDPNNGDITIMGDGQSQFLTFSNSGQFKKMVKMGVTNNSLTPLLVSKLNNEMVAIVGWFNCTDRSSTCNSANQTYLTQFSQQDLMPNCMIASFANATLRQTTNTTFLQLTDVTTSSPFNRTVITPQTVITDVLSFVKDLLVPLKPEQGTLCAGNKALFFSSTTTTTIKQTTSKPESANTSLPANGTDARQPTPNRVTDSNTIDLARATQIQQAASSSDSPNNTLLLSYVLGSLGGFSLIFGVLMLAVYLRRRPITETSSHAKQNQHVPSESEQPNNCENGAVNPKGEYGSVNPQPSAKANGYQIVTVPHYKNILPIVPPAENTNHYYQNSLSKLNQEAAINQTARQLQMGL